MVGVFGRVPGEAVGPPNIGSDGVVTWDLEGSFRLIYDYYVEELVPCLAEQGYQVGEVPTWEEFRGDLAEVGPWNPYEELQPEATWDEIEILTNQCPPGPPSEELRRYRTG